MSLSISKKTVGFLGLLACLVLATSAEAQINYSTPVPVELGNHGPVNVNNIIFFKHPAVPGSSQNFRRSPSVINFEGQAANAYDLLGAPGIAPEDQPPVVSLLNMLATPAGLCLENFLPHLTCSNNLPAGHPALQDPYLKLLPSWEQLAADLRNTLANERGVAIPNVILSGNPSSEPYGLSPLGSVVAQVQVKGGDATTVCYDISFVEELNDSWIACPAFGTVFISGYDSAQASPIQVLTLQSPVLIYRRNNSSSPYKFAGYLANPSVVDQAAAGFTQLNQFRIANAYFPVALATGNFSDTIDAPGAADIAVVSTSTAPHTFCRNAILQMTGAGRGTFRHGINCSPGVTWVRNRPIGDWSLPRSTFDIKDGFIAGPKTYDLTSGKDLNKTVLFAPSNAPVKDSAGHNHYFVYKYYEDRMSPIGSVLMPAVPQMIPSRSIEVVPPPSYEEYGPFKIATLVNSSGYSDFAITWKSLNETIFDTQHNLWKASYSPYVTVYRAVPNGSGVDYILRGHFQVPIPDSTALDDQAELAAVTFMKRDNGQQFLVVGNQKRVLVNGVYKAFDYLFPIQGGVVNPAKAVAVSYQDSTTADVPGVADITADPYGNLGSALRKPFFPAPEGCDPSQGRPYSLLWYGANNDLDSNTNGIPDRCECSNYTFGDQSSDISINVLNQYPDTCAPSSMTSGPHAIVSAPAGPNPQIFSPLNGAVLKVLEGLNGSSNFSAPLNYAMLTGSSSIPPANFPSPGPCGTPLNTFTGPLTKCDFMGDDAKELTVVLPKIPPVCDPTRDPACTPPTPELSLNQFCIAKVGRDDPRTAAVFEEDQKAIRAANDRVQQITGLKDVDIFVGAEGGVVHWECALIGGAFASVSKSEGALPNVSGNVAPFGVWQISGVAPLPFDRRPTADLEIKRPLRLTPLDVGELPVGSRTSPSISRSVDIRSILPDASAEEVMTGDGVQEGDRNYNINGKVLIKVLEPGDNFVAEGTSLSVNEVQSLFALDFLAPPALLNKSVGKSQLSYDEVFKELERRVQIYKQQGKPITMDIYRNLPWETSMNPQFVIAQNKIPAAVAAANLALQPPANGNTAARSAVLGNLSTGVSAATSGAPVSNDPNQVILPAYVVPAGASASGGGCNCDFQGREPPFFAFLHILTFLVPLGIFMGFRKKLARPAKSKAYAKKKHSK